MGHIIAIGGGEIGQRETLFIDRTILSLTKKECPHVLFLPAASGDAPGYCEAFHHYYASLGSEVRELLLHAHPSKESVREQTTWADIIYVGGGNTLRLIDKLREYELDVQFKDMFLKTKKILCGLSAGALCWFTGGMSDAIPGTWTLVAGLNMVQGLCAVGFSRDKLRKKQFETFLLKNNTFGYALDDKTALHISSKGEIASIIGNQDKTAKIRSYHFVNGMLTEKTLSAQ